MPSLLDPTRRLQRHLTTAALLIATLVTPSLASAQVQTGDSPSFSYNLAMTPHSNPWVVTGCEIDIQDEVLTLVSGDGWVRLPHRLQDFELAFQWRPLKSADWDSGLYFRSELPSGKSPWPKRYQINLKQGDTGHLLSAKGGDADQKLVREGDWNAFRLRVVGSTAKLWINDQLAWTCDTIEPLSGYVGIQSEVPLGGQHQFRDFQITELNTQSMFDGESLKGWQPTSDTQPACWVVRDGLLVCTGQAGGWLRSDKEYGDFNLRLEYLLQPKGNSGVYIRVPEDGNHHGPESGIEVQILDDAHEAYTDLKDYQYSASLYAISPAQPRVARPAGQWNSLEIETQGKHYQVWHNGQLVIDADADQVPGLDERRVAGFLGLQNHSEEVWFRNLRVTQPLVPTNPQVPSQ